MYFIISFILLNIGTGLLGRSTLLNVLEHQHSYINKTTSQHGGHSCQLSAILSDHYRSGQPTYRTSWGTTNDAETITVTTG